MNAKQSGFTLIELITVMVVLGVVSVGIAGFIRTGTDIYVDVTERDQVLSEGRFVVQRLNRELRNALPNSLRVAGNGTIQCIEFVPVLFSSFYFDIPVAPEPERDQIKIVATTASTDSYTYQTGDSVIVFPTSVNDVYSESDKRFVLDGAPLFDPADDKKQIIEFASDIQFATDSPSSRAYFIRQPVSYCATDRQILRHANYGLRPNQSINLPNGVLMAENLSNNLAGVEQDKPFRIAEATLTRNAFVLALLRFDLNDEIVIFNTEVHIPNAP